MIPLLTALANALTEACKAYVAWVAWTQETTKENALNALEDENTFIGCRRDLQPGDIVIFNFSHVGIVKTAPDDTGHFTCIEGNTNHAGSREGGAVWLKWRRTTAVRSRIRFRV